MSGFLSGVLTAWAAAQFGLGVFFLLAYRIGRREAEYFLFSLLCLALSVTSFGAALDYGGGSIEDRSLADGIIHSGVIWAAALNVHFALCFAQVTKGRKVLLLLYGLSCFYTAAIWTRGWWVDGAGELVASTLFGGRVEHWVRPVTPLAISFYFVSGVETFAAIALLAFTYRSGRREALGSLIGVLLMSPTVINDAGLALGAWNTVSLLPHGFLIYAFGVAGTLLLRYRLAAAELEQTAISLREKSEELRNSYAELRQVQDELVTKKQLAAVGELAAAIAHEVRNPLAVIVNAIAGLRRSGLREEDRATLLSIVDEEAARLNRLVTDLLRFARPVNVKRSPVSLVELANRSRSATMAEHEIVVDVADDPELQTVWVDPSLFRLVFDNLVENACQAMKDGGTVRIRVDRGSLGSLPAVRIEVKDTGHGMEPSVRERALDPFYTTRPSGTGLGLPIVHRIIEAHGGEIDIASEEGTGTTVTILIPLGEPNEGRDKPVVTEKVA